ncbi:hypothetical protein B0H10DRAFT_2021367 [Mycena sp. CBHHK59/15]|nr:hypothetical protein B0H10DRAFT_2021367 [Mycena sp. CBHHK59/15]
MSQVCSRWREIVLSQPKLWASVIVDFNSFGRRFRIETQLQRSGSPPLKIAFKGSGYALKHLINMLDILAKQCKRWETLSIYGP